MGGQDWRRQIENYAQSHIDDCRRKGQGTGERFPATDYRQEKTIQDAVVFLNGWLRTNYSSIPQLPSPPRHGRVRRKEWPQAWATFYDEDLRSEKISLNDLITRVNEGLDGLEAAQGQSMTDTAELELRWQLDEVYEVLKEHLAEGAPRHPELIDLQDEALADVLDYVDKLLDGETPEAPPSGMRGGEGNMLLEIMGVIIRFAQLTSAV